MINTKSAHWILAKAYSSFTIYHSSFFIASKRHFLVALSTVDSNNSERLIEYKQRTTFPANSIMKNPKKSSLCEDDYGEFLGVGLSKTKSA